MIYYRMEYTPGICTFAITAADDYKGIRLPSGYHIEGENRCPRNLPPDLADLTQPDGNALCILFNAALCAAAFSEEKACPVRKAKRAGSTRKKI